MTLPDSLLAFSDCVDIFERAMDDGRGCRVRCKDWDAASYLRLRLHKARALDRRKNQLAYEPGHQLHGASPFDEYVVRIKEVRYEGEGSRIYVYVEKTERAEIESLGDLNADEAVQVFREREAPPKITVTVNRRV